MRIYARVKSAGAKRDILRPVAYDIPDNTATLRELLCAVCAAEVSRYNAKTPEAPVVACLTADDISAQAEAGRVSFGAIYSDKKADPKKAEQAMLRAFADGLVRVLADGAVLTELDAPLHIEENAEFTFLRLTFLTGGL